MRPFDRGDEFEVPDEETNINHVERSVERCSVMSAERLARRFAMNEPDSVSNHPDSGQPFSLNMANNETMFSEKAVNPRKL